VYRAYLEQSDVFLGLYWQRYGYLGPGMHVSGLEEEFELSRALPRLLYVKAPAPDREARLGDLLIRVEQEASYRTFRTAAELGRRVRDDLATLRSERFAASRLQVAMRRPSPAQRGPRPLPVPTTRLVGREHDIDEVGGLIGRPGVRMVTLTGPGGIGKTRLALAVGERTRDGFDSGTVFVPVAAVTQPELVLAGIGRAVGAELAGGNAPLQALVEHLGDGSWLLILDNLEQVLDVAGDLGELLTRCPGVTILATSLTVLRLLAEREYPVLPLPLPAEPADVAVDGLASSPAVAPFVDRARAVRHDFALTESNANAIAEICRRLEGLPLAIELAAARIRLLDPQSLLRRLASSFDALGRGTTDLPERQQTLRATVEWSVGLLDDAERAMLEIAAVFVDGWTVDAAAEVAGLSEDRTLDLTEALVSHSLIYVDLTDHGPRSRMLETIRQFVAERLAARPDAGEIERRHADHYLVLAENADRPLRRVGQTDWVKRLQAEAGNLAAAVGWYLANDPAPLPHLLRVLSLLSILRDPMAEARSWVDRLLPAADSLEPEARAELLWVAAAIALEAGDDAAALAARERLAPLIDGIEDPYLRAVCHLAMAWTSPIVGDCDGSLRWASAALKELRHQDEPFWTAVAVATAGAMKTGAGLHADAARHLSEARDLAERFDSAWLTAWSRVTLGILAVVRGRFDEAGPLLHEGLSLGLEARSTPIVTLSLGAFALLAFAQGDAERGALLAGAADGLRRRAGVRAWPMMRQPEARLEARVRQALGANRFPRYSPPAHGSRDERSSMPSATGAPPTLIVTEPVVERCRRPLCKGETIPSPGATKSSIVAVRREAPAGLSSVPHAQPGSGNGVARPAQRERQARQSAREGEGRAKRGAGGAWERRASARQRCWSARSVRRRAFGSRARRESSRRWSLRSRVFSSCARRCSSGWSICPDPSAMLSAWRSV
jgi:predicted ATPase